ncbi:MAG: tetratricopeptide repeat protein [Fibrobacteres bacterium]|nr:tetratricopeptide repeat protein [Fibrobacterota bacterium]
MNLFKQDQAAKAPDKEAGLVEWFLDVFWPRFGKQTSYLLLAIAVVIAVGVWWNGDRLQSQAKENKELGKAYIYFSEDKYDSTESFLNAFVKASHSRLVQDKANLMLGQVQYAKAKYDDAIKSFSQIDGGNTDQPLVSSGALHGLASCYIQNKNYALATETLEKLVSQFGKRTGNPEEKVAGHEKVDLAPSVPNALWKLTLCYRELKNTEKEKATAQKLVKAYPESRESFDATRLLAQIP